MAPPRSTGLPYHLLYPIIAIILIGVPAFSTASSVWWVSTNTTNRQIRHGSRDYCGYNVSIQTGTTYYTDLGCVYGGWSYTEAGYLGMNIPKSISISLSKGAAILPFCFALLLVSTLHQAYTTHFSFKLEPNTDKLYTLAQVHFILSFLTTFIVWISWLVIICICGSATNANATGLNGTQVWWGQGVWLVFVAALMLLPWIYEAARWRYVVNTM